MKKLLILGNITCGKDLKPILVEVTHHSGVGSSLFAGVVEWCAATSHSPNLNVIQSLIVREVSLGRHESGKLNEYK